MYVGYRYFDTFGKEVSYPFGYGISYTDFRYTESSVTEVDDRFDISVTVTNIGQVAGREVVQVYVAAPQSKAGNFLSRLR